MIIEAIALALGNRQRGSESKNWFSKPVFAMGFALVCMVHGVTELQAVLSGLTLFLAYKPSFGEQIGAFGGWSTDRKTDILTNLLLTPLNIKNDRIWGALALFTRGLYFIPVFIISQSFGAAALIPFVFALSYMAGVLIEQKLLKRDGWETSEYILGGFLGILVVGF